ncbi:MAG: Calx-beta domain-containing protein, partial [Pseudomonadota bacterium]
MAFTFAFASISVIEPAGSEDGTNPRFLVDLGVANTSGAPIEIFYAVSGTAEDGSDFSGLTGSIVIPPGVQSVELPAEIIDDLSFETLETISLQLTGSDNPSVFASPVPAFAIIEDNEMPTADLSVTMNGDEEGPVSIEATVTLSAVNETGEDIVFDLNDLGTGSATGGTDYLFPPGAQIVVPNGSAVGTIVIPVVDDVVIENLETVDLQISNPSNPAVTISTDTATATIADNDEATVSIAATQPDAREPDIDGEFTVTINGQTEIPVTITFEVSGSATEGADYETLTRTVTIPAGTNPSATIDIAVIDDDFAENLEDVIVTLVSTDNTSVTVDASADSATVTIADDAADAALISIEATDPSASEAGDPGQFTVFLAGETDQPVVVTFEVSGSATEGGDYVSLARTVTIPAGTNPSATIDVSAIDDLEFDPDETVVVTLVGTDNTSVSVDALAAQATVTIADDEIGEGTLSIAANDPVAAEPNSDGQFTVSLDGILVGPLTVSYTVTGTANNGIDYETISGTVTIPAGTDPSAVIDVSVIDDLIFDPDETVIVTLNDPGEPNITLGTDTATVTIADDEIGAGMLSIAANDPDAAEPNDPGQFTVTLTGTLAAPLTVSYSVAGTATPGGDYTALTGTVTIPAGTNPSAVI